MGAFSPNESEIGDLCSVEFEATFPLSVSMLL